MGEGGKSRRKMGIVFGILLNGEIADPAGKRGLYFEKLRKFNYYKLPSTELILKVCMCYN